VLPLDDEDISKLKPEPKGLDCPAMSTFTFTAGSTVLTLDVPVLTSGPKLEGCLNGLVGRPPPIIFESPTGQTLVRTCERSVSSGGRTQHGRE
jgi:hypothetical protein